MLTHYTTEIPTLANILTHGFAWFPNRRRLAEQLIPMHDYSKREPQQFGMISFTELRPEEAQAHTNVFGHLGIVVSDAWAHKHDAQRVIYVESKGPYFEALRMVFKIGYGDLRSRIKYPSDTGWLMSFENKAAARAIAGASLWENLLTLWEYLEPAESAYQREWRIVNPVPDYSLGENKQEVIAKVSPPWPWAKHIFLKVIEPRDVEAIVCPSSLVTALRTQLPMGYKDTFIIETAPV